MICWVASFPRSGNTLTRLILRQCFNIESMSMYKETEIDHVFNDNENLTEEKYNALLKSKDMFFVKTHHIPTDGMPVIYIVRNGIDANCSLSRMWSSKVADIILMQGHQFPDWSAHYWGFHFNKRGMIELRFEDLISDPNKEADRIGKFIGMDKKTKYVDNFDRLKISSKVKGNAGKSVNELSQDDSDLFWCVHGEVMNRLKYER